jgi:hypothetical protein
MRGNMEPSRSAPQATEIWEDEGGFSPMAELPLIGTVNQIEWAERIRCNVFIEFDRVAKALVLTAEKRTGQRQRNAQLALAILLDKRNDVMAKDRAGYFILGWQELEGKVRQMITEDPRYAVIRASRLAPWFSMDPKPEARQDDTE